MKLSDKMESPYLGHNLAEFLSSPSPSILNNRGLWTLQGLWGSLSQAGFFLQDSVGFFFVFSFFFLKYHRFLHTTSWYVRVCLTSQNILSCPVNYVTFPSRRFRKTDVPERRHVYSMAYTGGTCRLTKHDLLVLRILCFDCGKML